MINKNIAHLVDREAQVENILSVSVNLTGFRSGKTFLSKLFTEFRETIISKIRSMPAVNAQLLPCNIGDSVYMILPIHVDPLNSKNVMHGKVVGFEVNENNRNFAWVHFDDQPKGSARAITFEKFGKNVFLKEEDAWEKTRLRSMRCENES